MFYYRVHVMNEDVKEREWGDILSAVKVVDKTGFHPLDHIAGLTYLVKRGENDKHVIRYGWLFCIPCLNIINYMPSMNFVCPGS